MAALRWKHDALVVLSGDSFVVYQDRQETQLKLPEKCRVEEGKEGDKKEDKKPRKDVAKTANCVLVAAFSPSGNYFAIGDDEKQLHIYRVNPEWILLNSSSLVKRATALAFTHSDADVVVATRNGIVYRYPVREGEPSEGVVALGHNSIVLDVALSRDDCVLMTSDRDEKVRFSHYPNAYNVMYYGLLHTKYVSQVIYVEPLNCVVSGSGDGRVAVWSMEGACQDCSQVETERLPAAGDQNAGDTGTNGDDQPAAMPLAVKKILYDDQCSVVAAIYHKSPRLHVYTLQCEGDELQLGEKQEVELAGECWDISFDAQHRLWALQACEGACVEVYSCEKTGNQLQVKKAARDEGTDWIVKQVNGRWDSLNSVLDWRTEFINLDKVALVVDNVQKYLDRKEERMKKISKAAADKSDEPPEKKLKS